ncbi:MAG: DUF975 family protein [Ruminococcus sp.]|jgi:uncharacterized membrane protein
MRKEIKAGARKSLKKHYLTFVAVCLIALFLGVESSNFDNVIHLYSSDKASDENVVDAGSVSEEYGLADIIEENQPEESGAEEVHKTSGQKRGVLGPLINGFTSGSFEMRLASAINSFVGSETAGEWFLVLGGLAVIFVFWFFVQNLFCVISARIFLEGRCYQKVPVQRFLFLLRVRRWCRAAWILFVEWVYRFLWTLTVIGGIIKHYSYFLVPYIVAENPDIKAGEAITLSRKMMKGHKWECFVLELSFIGWRLLGLVTFGVTEVLYSTPYETAAYCEYYVRLRKEAIEKEIENVHILNDRYLYETARDEVIQERYADVIAVMEQPEERLYQLKGIQKFFADYLGILLKTSEKERAYEESQAHALRIYALKAAVEKKIYPGRLFPIPEEEKRKWIEIIHYLRHYSIWSLILLFFIFSFVGWAWEVSLHLITDGIFVNRGVLHGPWLPIYGSGGILILTLLHRARRHPALEFSLIVILCGVVEYTTSYFLEILHNGKKWWDYSGYFLNLNGRICAEGLFVFGVGGMAFVYLAAPVLDNLIRKIKGKILIPLCLILLLLFAGDAVYSTRFPNTGKGITDYDQKSYLEWQTERNV